MKNSLWLLVASVLVNGALILVWVSGSSAHPRATVVPQAGRSGTVSGTGAVTVDVPTKMDVNVPVAGTWPRLRTDNLDELNRRLRAAGFPAKAVRAMLAMAIEDQITARREALVGKPEDTPYWKYPGQAVTDPQLQAQLREINLEVRALLYKYVNGPDALADNADALIAAQRRFGNLSLDKLQQLTALQHDFEETQMHAAIANSTRPRDEASMSAAREALGALDKERRAAVARLLTPAELEQYELRNDAGGLRMQLDAFRPSEEEFKALYAIQKSLYHWTPDPNLTPEQQRALQADYKARIDAALGPERAADYSALQSAGSDKLPRLLARLELPLSTITTINAVRDDIGARALAVTSDRTLSAAQQSAQLAALVREADELLGATLGARGYEAYQDIKGDWLRALKPRPGGP